MATYAIDECIGILGLKVVRVKGSVEVRDPSVALSLNIDPPWPLKSHTYRLKVSPQKPQDADSHKFSLARVKVGMRLDTHRSIVRVSIQAQGEEQWSHPYPYGGVHGIQPIEMFGTGAFIDPLKRYADHTYAIATNAQGAQRIWRCGGDYEGGESLGTGKGPTDLCDCLSCRECEDEKELGGLARIRYGIDGVCHQAANRTLYPAGMEVTRARAYTLSHQLYGRLGLEAPDDIGRERWTALTGRCHVPTVAGVPNGAEVAQEELALAEARRLLLSGGGDRLAGAQVDDLLAEREEAVAAKNQAIQELWDARLEGGAFADRVNAAAHGYLDSARRILSQGCFTDLFGPPSEPDWLLVNPKLAERIYTGGVPHSYRQAN